MLFPPNVLDLVFGNVAFAAGHPAGNQVYSGPNYHLYNSIKHQLPTGVTEKNSQGLRLNVTLWQQRSLIVYGDPATMSGNDFAKGWDDNATYHSSGGYYRKSGVAGEYRYHGYTQKGQLYTNEQFKRDKTSKTALSNKNWIIRPWQNLPASNKNALAVGNSNPFYANPSAAFVQHAQSALGFTINKGINYPSRTSTYVTDPTQYLYVTASPTMASPGAGILWHRSGSGKIWYQTFFLDKMNTSMKTLVPVKAHLQVLNEAEFDFSKLQGQEYVNLQVKVTGELMDYNYVNNEELRAKYYTRGDIDKWKLSINGQSVTLGKDGSNLRSSNFTVRIPVESLTYTEEGEIIYPLNAEAVATFIGGKTSRGTTDGRVDTTPGFGQPVYADLQSHFTVTPVIEFLKVREFMPSQVNYVDASIKKEKITKYAITITRKGYGDSQTFTYDAPIDPEKVNEDLHSFMQSTYDPNLDDIFHLMEYVREFTIEQTVYDKQYRSATSTKDVTTILAKDKEYVYVNPKPVVPEYGFDKICVDIKDNTDMSEVETREVFVDGKKVKEEDLFDCNYIFGEGNHGIHQIHFVYTSTTGAVSEAIEYIQIHDTKPRAEFALEGTFKQNRTMLAKDTTDKANDKVVIDKYPIESYKWTVKAVNGGGGNEKTFYTKEVDEGLKFMAKQPGAYTLELVVKNSLGRESDPYVVEFSIMEDLEPFVILHPFDAQISRGGEVDLRYEPTSTDGDKIGKQKIEVYFDEKNDGSFTKLVDTFEVTDPTTFTSYVPPLNHVGEYKMVATVDESFSGETFPEYITDEDKRVGEFTTYFQVENVIPYSDIYTDAPTPREDVEVFFMLDKNLPQAKTDYVKGNAVTIENNLRLENVVPNIDVWDMKTYTYQSIGSMTLDTNTQYPSATAQYSKDGWYGTINRTGVINNPYSVDEGQYQTRQEKRTFERTCDNSDRHSRGYSNPYVVLESWGDYACPKTSYVNEDGYKGDIPYTNWVLIRSEEKLYDPFWDRNTRTTRYHWYKQFFWRMYYSGTLTKDVTYWVSNWKTYNDYTGTYEGKIFKDVRQEYANPFKKAESQKYIVYVTDGTISDLKDLEMVRKQHTDAQVIVVGADAAKSQTTYDHFFLNNREIEPMVQDAVNYIGEINAHGNAVYVEVGEEFPLQTVTIEDEGDAIIAEELMYVHDADFFDNSQGKSSFAIPQYDENAWKSVDDGSATYIKRFDKVGRYQILRRVQDKPSTDSAFDEYNYWSNESSVEIIAHRKPIATGKVDWDFNTATGNYNIKWADESYDLDHQFEDPVDKGIIERNVKWKLSSATEWNYGIPDNIPSGTYDLELIVRDQELAWSDPFKLTFTLDPIPDIQLDAKARTELPAFSMTEGIPASEQLRMYDITARYPYTHDISVAMFKDGVQKTTPQSIKYFAGTKVGNDHFWNDVVHTIPATLPDGDYMFRVTATGNYGKQSSKEFSVKVKTPVDLEMGWPEDAEKFPQELLGGDTYNLKARTSKYANVTTLTLYQGTEFETSFNLNASAAGVKKKWNGNHTVPRNIPEGIYTAQYKATTPNGNVETVTTTFFLTQNKPPVADFVVTPETIYEWDTVTLKDKSTDPDNGDYITEWEYTVYSPSGEKTVYSQQNPSFQTKEVGAWYATLRVKDSRGKWSIEPMFKEFVVNQLSIEGAVSHTDQWNERRKEFNQNKTGTDESPRSYSTFWAGEKFMLDANVTDTGSSTTKPESVTAVLVKEGTLSLLSSTDQVVFDGEMWNATFDQLPDGDYTFRFTVNWNNGAVKTSDVDITIEDSVWGVTKTHRTH